MVAGVAVVARMVNMLTRTSAKELFDSDGILMASVDTGRITDELPPHEGAAR
jgi:hypothetical protein